MSSSMRRLSLAACVAIMLAGCASPQNYVQRRAADLLDVFALELTVGPGIDFHANATRFVGTAVGVSFQVGPMVHGRQAGLGMRQSVGMLVAGMTGAGVDTPSDEGRGGLWSLFMAAPSYDSDLPSEGLGAWDFDVGASCIVGAHVGFNPAELVDFVLGFTTLDIGDDDCITPPTCMPPTPEKEPFEPFYWTPLHQALLDLEVDTYALVEALCARCF